MKETCLKARVMARMAPLPSLGGWVIWYASPSHNPYEIKSTTYKTKTREKIYISCNKLPDIP
jgi:hypothetical protein